ncbi:MAG: glycosyltransferase family 4 protein, partial [Candidatus Omnitrophica bacterium]|nr:glycosyltransferase family 4 protein [Candidatus Omnitrophota bacterium]
MRIAFVTNEFVTEKHFYGGLANYLYRVAKALAEEGHEVHVVTGSETDKKDFQFNGIFIHRITLWSIPPCLKPRDMQGPTAERLLFNIKVWRKLRAINKKTKIDIIQYTNVYACGLIPGLLLRIPYVVRVSSYRPLWDNLNKKKWAVEYKMHAWIERLQLKLSRHTYVPSKTMKKILEETGLKNIKIIRSPAYIETGAWDFSYCDEMLKDKEYVLFFGRFQKRKGFHVVAQAAPSFLRQHPGAYMVCIGLNEDYKTTLMKENAVSLCGDNAARMIFMHQLQHAQLYPIIQRAKLVVLPSLIENLSNACL